MTACQLTASAMVQPIYTMYSTHTINWLHTQGTLISHLCCELTTV